MRFDPLKLDSAEAFEQLAETIRANLEAVAPGNSFQGVRELLDSGVHELRTALPELGDRDIARCLMVTGQFMVQMIDAGPRWTRHVMTNVVLDLAEQVWREDKPGAAKLLEQIDDATACTAEISDHTCTCLTAPEAETTEEGRDL